MTFRHRHLDYPELQDVSGLGPAALDELLERGDLTSWAPVAAAVRAEPSGALADEVLRLCDAHPMYGTSALWRTWILSLREEDARAFGLREVRRRRGLTQQYVATRLGISQSDVSKLERRADVRLSTLSAYVQAIGGDVEVRAVFADDDVVLVRRDVLKRRLRATFATTDHSPAEAGFEM